MSLDGIMGKDKMRNIWKVAVDVLERWYNRKDRRCKGCISASKQIYYLDGFKW